MGLCLRFISTTDRGRCYIFHVIPQSAPGQRQAAGPGFRSQPRPFRVTVLGKLCACVYLAAKLVTALLRVARVTADLVESNGSLLPAL